MEERNTGKIRVTDLGWETDSACHESDMRQRGFIRMEYVYSLAACVESISWGQGGGYNDADAEVMQTRLLRNVFGGEIVHLLDVAGILWSHDIAQ